MRNNFLQITDKKGTTFKMYVSTPSAGTKVWRGLTEKIGGEFVDGRWKTLDKGFLRYHFGKTRSRKSKNGDFTTRDLLILGSEGIETYDDYDQFGMQLFEYEAWNGTNDEGEGFVIQPWVVSLTPGRILWTVMDWESLKG